MAHFCAVKGMKHHKGKYKLKKGISEKIIHNDLEVANNAQELTNEEFFGERTASSGLNESEADEGASEGLGDGKIGRTTGNSEE